MRRTIALVLCSPGMIAACEEKINSVGISAFTQAEVTYQDIERQLQPNHYRRWTLHTQYAAPIRRLNDELLQFIRRFYLTTHCVRCRLYRKMMYGIYDLIQKVFTLPAHV
ncbi:MAG: hypothetical protein IPL35_04530 [Sphingobacteriales bacterium]|nr:hypothetical protein [Sphingobacteriales bacterium]